MNIKTNLKIVIVLYLVGLLAGIAIGELINLNLEKTDTIIDSDKLATTVFIIERNLIVFAILLSGIILFKIPTILNLIFNGSILGFMMSGIPQDELFVNVIAILIHGIPELSGFFIAATLALNGYNRFMENKRMGFKMLFLAVSLIIFAAFLETYISPFVYTITEGGK